jgi:site-specific recombinase XerD
VASPRPRLIEQVRERIRLKHYSLRTEQAYVDWIKRYIRFHGNRNPSELGSRDLVAFLTHLAADRNVAARSRPALRRCAQRRRAPPPRQRPVVQRAVREALRETRIVKLATPRTLRHSFATPLLEAGHDICTVPELLGHSGVRPTMVYTHVLNRGGGGAISPFDCLARDDPSPTHEKGALQRAPFPINR